MAMKSVFLASIATVIGSFVLVAPAMSQDAAAVPKKPVAAAQKAAATAAKAVAKPAAKAAVKTAPVSSYVSSAAWRGLPALMIPMGEMHMAELLEAMLPSPASRGEMPSARMRQKLFITGIQNIPLRNWLSAASQASAHASAVG